MVVLRGMSTVITPPSVSMPTESGVTSSSNRSLTSPASTPPWIAAPMATTSSGFTPLCGSLPKYSFTTCCTRGMRVEPPTSTTSSTSEGLRPASASACLSGPIVRCTRPSTSDSSFARVSFIVMCLGPEASAVINGRLISVSITDDSSILAFSPASFRRCNAMRSLLRSMPSDFLNSDVIHSTTSWSKSSPPRWVSPLVDFTSTTPSPTSSTEMSNVPPPRSNTAMVSSFFWSRPYASAAAVGSLTMRRTVRPAI